VRDVQPVDPLPSGTRPGDFAAGLLARHGRNAHDLDTVYVLADSGLPSERLLSRAAAIRYLLESLGGAWNSARLLRLLPDAVLNWVYTFVVANRYRWFGRYDSCPIPTPAERAKFIEDTE
jgi:predicted DCC family thiol-disulfide oxidoreductase YuxK